MTEYKDHDYILVCPDCLDRAREAYPDAPEWFIVELSVAGSFLCDMPLHLNTEEDADAEQ